MEVACCCQWRFLWQHCSEEPLALLSAGQGDRPLPRSLPPHAIWLSGPGVEGWGTPGGGDDRDMSVGGQEVMLYTLSPTLVNTQFA